MTLRTRFVVILMLVIAVLMPVAAISTGWRPAPDFWNVNRQAESLDLLNTQLIALRKRANAEDDAIVRRLETLPMATALSAEQLITAQGRAGARATLNEFRAIIADRASMRQQRTIEGERMINAIPDARMRESARAGAHAQRDEHAAWARDLDLAQGQLADAYDTIVNWCESEGNRLKVKNKQFVLSSAAQQAQLDALLASLQKAERREEETVTRLQKLAQKTERDFQAIQKERTHPGVQ